MLIQKRFLKGGAVKNPRFFAPFLLPESVAWNELKRQFAHGAIVTLHVLEPRFITGNRFAERGEGCRQNFYAVEIHAGLFERAVKLAFHPINCRIVTHKPALTLYEIKEVLAS
jgi:hypothetical protein